VSARLLVLVALGAALLVSCVSLVYVQHLRRELFSELKALERDRDRMQVEWGQLQLEASTWAAQDRIEQVAVERLEFRIPSPERVVVVAD
jgi:cell division protein FtsL